MAKWWTTELQKQVVDAGVQLHGGYGYMNEYPISKAYADSRIQTIYGGTTEIHEGDHRSDARAVGAEPVAERPQRVLACRP